jgi:aminoglycoside phosphotransferase (APT) family kinase protein
MEQTAVEFLENQYNSNGKLTPVDFYQAKEMEKQQIIDTYIEASPRLEDITKESAEQYYNETFKSE